MPEQHPEVLANHTIPTGGGGHRLDQYLPQVFPQVPTRSSARKVIKKGRIRVDGVHVEGSRFLKDGQHIELLLPEEPPPAYDRDLRVLYEDDAIAVIIKPPGLPVSGNRHRSVEHALPVNLKESAAPDALPWPRPVHRLDVRTQGLLITAKTLSSLTHISKQFEHRQVFKRYEALAAGKIEGRGEITLPVEGRDALSKYEIIEEVRSLHSDYLTWVNLWPKTGRTHQLRQHLASLGAAVLGDDLYGEPPVLRGAGLFLAAMELRFTHPVTGEVCHFTWETPKKFRAYLDREDKRWHRAQTQGGPSTE